VSLHKDESAYLLSPDGSSIETLGESDSVLKDMYVVHVVDLLTKGSSAYNPNVSPPSGWIVELRKRGATIEHLVSVVSRLQGAEEILGDQGVEVYAFVTIDTDFVSNYSNQRERALAYMQDPMAWSQNYLRDHGVAAFKESFDPASGKLARAEKFLALFESTLAELGLLEGLRGRMSSAN
ncbi:MAG: hypothetical protein KDD62_03435, partial [Bdellovibrionales bacterium]|nr:hypothetical protein [Bdellovibrionales bacterium]